MALVYKITPRDEWAAATQRGLYEGAPVDLRDGFIHFSTAGQVEETAARHFAGQTNLLLVAFDETDLGEKLVFEPSRGGALFPHLYAPLNPALARSVHPLPLRDGAHDFSGLLP
ncbi:uncharacterized protein (DUF952 family) [Rhodoblastus sphagnicola]|uniref:DUF952 domain-containing protein n=1 Tax=Rhodoblastus sphagnicola TaxID=333368 RepID=UPI001814E76A|nr:DUF952 domain-containing protein [Rhodoblastus sphagnicola]MBB4197411.1 uncharacterized protein (DUF952 family) [Rhodoblastus sphagnicola]